MPLQITPNPENPSDVTITSPHLGGTGVRLASHGSREAALFAPVVDALTFYEAEVARAAADTTSTPEGKRLRVAEPLKKLAAAIERTQIQLNDEATSRETFRAALYAAPTIDAAAIPLDVETRRMYLEASPATRETLDAEMLAGRNDALSDALQRCPVPQALPPGVAAIRQARTEQRHGDKLSALAINAEDADRVASGCRAILGLVTRRQQFADPQ